MTKAIALPVNTPIEHARRKHGNHLIRKVVYIYHHTEKLVRLHLPPPKKTFTSSQESERASERERERKREREREREGEREREREREREGERERERERGRERAREREREGERERGRERENFNTVSCHCTASCEHAQREHSQR